MRSIKTNRRSKTKTKSRRTMSPTQLKKVRIMRAFYAAKRAEALSFFYDSDARDAALMVVMTRRYKAAEARQKQLAVAS